MGVFLSPDGRIRPGWVVVVFGAVAGAALVAFSIPLALLNLLPHSGTRLDDPRVFFNSMLVLAAAGAATAVCALAFRAPVGLREPRWARRLSGGAAVGALAVAVAAGLPPLLGHGALHLSALPAGVVLKGALVQLCFLAPTGVGEELLVRGVPLRALSQATRPALAVFLTGAAFGLMHFWNPASSWVSTFNVALVGWWFGAMVLRTGSLWAAIGMHVAWNFFEGFVFGMPVSGVQPAHALLAAGWEPRGFWCGGDFGPEASGLTAVVLAAGLLLTLLLPTGEGGPQDRVRGRDLVTPEQAGPVATP